MIYVFHCIHEPAVGAWNMERCVFQFCLLMFGRESSVNKANAFYCLTAFTIIICYTLVLSDLPV